MRLIGAMFAEKCLSSTERFSHNAERYASPGSPVDPSGNADLVPVFLSSRKVIILK